MEVVHGGGWFIRSSHVALIYSPKPRIYFIHYAFPGAEINSEKRPQADSSFSRPVWLQFCFQPLRSVTQGAHPRDPKRGTSGQVGFWGGRESVGFVMSEVLYGTEKLALVQGSRGTGI